MNKIIIKGWSLMLCLMLIFHTATAQATPIESIDGAIRTGNAEGLSRYFGNSTDITINNNQKNYSKAQGEWVIRDFFNKNSPRNYVSEKRGNSVSTNATYYIGNLTTSSGTFKVYIALKPYNNTYLLTEINFEKN